MRRLTASRAVWLEVFLKTTSIPTAVTIEIRTSAPIGNCRNGYKQPIHQRLQYRVQKSHSSVPRRSSTAYEM